MTLKLLLALLSLPLSALAAQSAPSPGEASYLESLVHEARARNLGSHIQWHNLLHYQKRFFSGYRSQADNKEFFFATDGSTNPQAEVEATLRAMFSRDPELMSDGPEQQTSGKPGETRPQHPQCGYPARYMFLARELKIDRARLPAPKCERYTRFREALSAKSATVVFSSYYLNNPASAFGHSFLRINKAPISQEGRRYELLDYGLNYSAVPFSKNPLVYAVSGIAGFFPGTFTSIPYYYKVREYNDYESRDLWEYDLNLTQEQVDMIVAHAWELGQALFNYYYLDENCSYHVMSMLDAGAPELNLTRRLGAIVIPADTIKVLMDTPGLVRKVNFRPSGRLQFQQRLKTLSAEQRAALLELVARQQEDAPVSFSQKQRAEVLDAAIDYIDFQYSSSMIKPESEPATWKQKLLLARARLPVQSEPLKVVAPLKEMPHLGHDSRRVYLDYGYGARAKGSSRLGFRYALHDLLDPMPGYPGYAQMEIFNARLRYNTEPRTLRLDDFALVHVTSLSPLSSFNKRVSWRVKFGARSVRDYTCEDCLAGNALAGAGVATQPFGDTPINLYSLFEFEVAGSPDFDRGPVRFGAGPMIGLRVPVTESWFNLAQASYRLQFPTHRAQYFEWSFESRYALTKAFALNARWLRIPIESEGSFGGMYYF